ncbi:MAG: beta-eliminating lyase-related protein [Clostridia bacterium]|nr:beta-eliminating lyase-related protein [Clostridia bacterium]
MFYFNCDYMEGCHPEVLARLTETNLEQCIGYGEDDYCARAAEIIRDRFDCPGAAVHFLVGGTQTNTVVISSVLRPFEGVICAETGHINVHETGAIEATGHKVLAVPSEDGLIRPEQIDRVMKEQGDDEHIVRPGMVYISFPTEVGTLYTLSQLEDIYAACRRWGLYLFIDGARLGYGLTAEECDVTPADIARCSDAFYIGGTKVGALFGEAVVITHPDMMPRFRYMMKRAGGLLAKGRLLGVQFIALLENDLYFDIAEKAVQQAGKIRQKLLDKGIPLMVDSPTNQLFPIFTAEQMAALTADFGLAVWKTYDDGRTAARICTSWCTPDEQVDALMEAIERV